MSLKKTRCTTVLVVAELNVLYTTPTRLQYSLSSYTQCSTATLDSAWQAESRVGLLRTVQTTVTVVVTYYYRVQCTVARGGYSSYLGGTTGQSLPVTHSKVLRYGTARTLQCPVWDTMCLHTWCHHLLHAKVHQKSRYKYSKYILQHRAVCGTDADIHVYYKKGTLYYEKFLATNHYLVVSRLPYLCSAV